MRNSIRTVALMGVVAVCAAGLVLADTPSPKPPAPKGRSRHAKLHPGQGW